MVDFSFIVSLYVSDLDNVTISTIKADCNIIKWIVKWI